MGQENTGKCIKYQTCLIFCNAACRCEQPHWKPCIVMTRVFFMCCKMHTKAHRCGPSGDQICAIVGKQPFHAQLSFSLWSCILCTSSTSDHMFLQFGGTSFRPVAEPTHYNPPPSPPLLPDFPTIEQLQPQIPAHGKHQNLICYQMTQC